VINQSNIYPNSGANPTIDNADKSRPNLAVCFSGGGSRALTCAWGQLIGLINTQVMDRVRYLSSVSGGTWASSIYTFLPDTITDADLLGSYIPPQNLSLSDGSGKSNVNNLSKHSLGQVPAGMTLTSLAATTYLFLSMEDKCDHKWLWAYIVANYILDPYELRDEGEHVWSSSKQYTLSADYADTNFPTGAPPIDNFFMARQNRPFLIMNDNIMIKVPQINSTSFNIVQLPNQATPVSVGSKGQTPCEGVDGDGTVESYGFTSFLEQKSAVSSPVKINITQPYSLIDSVSTSSAFFAEFMLSLLQDEISSTQRKQALIDEIKQRLTDERKKMLLDNAKADRLEFKLLEDAIEHYVNKVAEDALHDVGSIVPAYNYWPIGDQSKNKTQSFTDGGTLDNTGIVGLLSQTDNAAEGQAIINIIAFDNTDVALKKSGDNIIAGAQAAPLFGIDFNSSTGSYEPFSLEQKDPTNPKFKATSLIKVFDNAPNSTGVTPFEELVNGLYASSCGSSGNENAEPAFVQLELTTSANPLANIVAGRKVNLLYVQNTRINSWQNDIGDPALLKQIEDGQKTIWPFADFADFPYYNTFTKIGLSAKESNCLSQMWAWATSHETSPLTSALKSFVETH
jgi:hypothetical protein